MLNRDVCGKIHPSAKLVPFRRSNLDLITISPRYNRKVSRPRKVLLYYTFALKHNFLNCESNGKLNQDCDKKKVY